MGRRMRNDDNQDMVLVPREPTPEQLESHFARLYKDTSYRADALQAALRFCFGHIAPPNPMHADSSYAKQYREAERLLGEDWQHIEQPTPEQVREACALACVPERIPVSDDEWRVRNDCADAIRAMDLSKIGGSK